MPGVSWFRGRFGSNIAAVVLVLLGLAAASGSVRATPGRQAEVASAEEKLADRFAPIAMLKRQVRPCDADGEPYAPAPVEVVLGDPDVALLEVGAAGSGPSDVVVTTAPTATDLVGLDERYYLDLPGNPRAPRCDFEQHFRERMGLQQPVTYARVVPLGEGQLALQYWLFYVFNDFNNTHEGDWEMVQLLFDADSAEEALGQEPVEIALAQHGGGETSGWNDDKLQREGDRPVIYVAAGSHATQYGSAVYLGWGENGTGFGCDDTTGPSDRVPLAAVLIPNDATDASGRFAWTAFGGRWGERQPWEYNGPTGPNLTRKWASPFDWQAELRTSGTEVPGAAIFGPDPTEVFCRITGFGSYLLTRYRVYPTLVVATVATIVVGAAALVFLGRPTLAAAWGLYRRHWHLFVRLGLILIPIGLLANGLQYLVLAYPPGKQISALMNHSPGAGLAAALTVGGLQQVVGLVLVGPAIFAAVGTIQAGGLPTFGECYSQVLRRLRPLAKAVLRVVLVVALLAISIIGIPWAIARAVRWQFTSQAVILDGAAAPQAPRLSARAVAGRWWQTAAIGVLLLLVGASPGPLLGILLMVLASASVQFVTGLSSLIYAILLPLSVIGFTLLYRDLQRRQRPQPVAADLPEPRRGAASVEV